MSGTKKTPSPTPPKRSEPKIGDVQSTSGIKMKLTSVKPTQGGGFLVEASAEDFARERGYRTTDEALGFRIEHYPPVFVPKGTPRDPSKLTDADWDFRELLMEPLEIKSLALFHELARESARMREAFRCYNAGREQANARDDNRKKTMRKYFDTLDEVNRLAGELNAEKEAVASNTRPDGEALPTLSEKEKALAEARARLAAAVCEKSNADTEACFGAGVHEWAEAEKFIMKRLTRFPYAARGLARDWIASDTPWLSIVKTNVEKFISEVKEAIAEAGKKRRRNRAGLRMKDVQTEGTGGMFDEPLQVATEWRTGDGPGATNRPCFHYNNGLPGLPEVASKGNGTDAERVVTESLDLCVCLNFRDEEIIDAFTAWLKHRRASLPSDLEAFRASSERPYTKLNNKDVDAALKGIAALRLRFKFGPKEAAYKFNEIYFPKKNGTPDFGNVAKAAEIACQWQRMFFRYCPLDSAGCTTPTLGKWDLECPLCFKVWQLPHEPEFNYETMRCPCCDHREEMCWTPSGWVPHVFESSASE